MERAETYDLYRDGRHFDLLYPGGTDGIPRFWSELVRQCGGPMLEMACGTGTASVALAQVGVPVTGIDLSPAMLEVAREKGAAAGVSIEWIEGDMRDFHLGKEFALIILVGNSMCHLLDLQSVEACLACAREHVQKPNGRFAVSVFVPGQALLKPESTEREPFGDYDDPDGRGHVVITHTYRYDPATQIKHITTYQRVGDDPAEVTGELKMRMFFPQELDALLTYNGFRIVDKFGDHEGKTPFGADSTQQLVVCALA